ncbi:MAG TPA: hypothetical protein VH331_11540 [Allosphingosinicella sp.]|nr:hypothetical protein [Allosphingosinicella sp.]
MRRLILLLVLPLAGCWEGGVFYAASESLPALPPGTYRSIPSDHPEDAKIVRVSIRKDGMTTIVDKEATNTLGFAPLGGAYFVMWLPDEERDQAVYALFERKQGRYRILVPICDRTKAIATAAGATVAIDPKVTTCRFKTRPQLEDGLRHLEGREMDSVELIPMPPAGGAAGTAP